MNKLIFELDQKKGNSQRNKYPQTIGEKLFWSLANIKMAEQALKEKKLKYNDVYNVRTCIYEGLLNDIKEKRTKASKDFLEDEKLKIKLPYVCYYCGETNQTILETDHMIPVKKGGPNDGENLIPACKHCNSSKGAMDMLEWMNKKSINPTVIVLRRYVKLAIKYCKENNLLEIPADDHIDLNLPFSFDLIPIRLPKPGDIKMFVTDYDK
ncbi:MAG: HNH endonuclease [Bacteroidetes bacterium]|nr:HNH endonuclease [Bacteroidota bacterium]